LVVCVFQGLLYENPSRWSFLFNQYAILTRTRQHQLQTVCLTVLYFILTAAHLGMFSVFGQTVAPHKGAPNARECWTAAQHFLLCEGLVMACCSILKSLLGAS